jgi:hypothetical protein
MSFFLLKNWTNKLNYFLLFSGGFLRLFGGVVGVTDSDFSTK